NTGLTSVKCSIGSVKMVCTRRPQMFLPPRYGGISRLYSFAIRFNDGPCQSPNYPRLARTTQDPGDSIIPPIRQLLPAGHTCLLGYRYSPYPAHPQGHQVGFLRKVSKGVTCPQEASSLGSVVSSLDSDRA